ncbi:MAG: ABC transporter ATP-binding protein [Armatimonadota bacterium]|nr:ABC transporter ATP-binding protein [Armatimonadota bacterium]
MPILTIRRLTHYFGGLKAVSDFNLDLEEGELIGIIGPNGAGKTTVFNLITGVYVPTSGQILFNGHDLVGMPSYHIVSLGIARTFQTIRLFKDLSVLDNVRIAFFSQVRYSPLAAILRTPRCVAEERAIYERSIELLRIFQLDRYADQLAKNLPYGEQRKLEMARALATRPRLLLLDEPAAGMNPGEAQRLMERIQWIRRQFNLTIMLIEHQMRVVMGICERIIAMDFGAIIAEGPPEAIQNHPRVLEAYLGKEAAS